MMDLKQLQSAVGSMIGDPSFRQIQRPEVTAYLNMAQQELVSMMWDYDRTKFLTVNKQTSTSGTADYLVPSNMRQIVRVLYALKEYRPLAPEDLEALTDNDWKRPIKGVSGFYTEMQGSEPGRSQVRIFPTPNTTVADEIEVWYYQAARDFHPQGVYSGIATGGSTTTLLDTGAPFMTSGTAYPNFWLGANILFTNASNDGQMRRVKSVTEATGTFTLDSALSTAAASTNTYEIRQVSILPPHIHHIMPYYAAWLAAPQVGKDGTQFFTVWTNFMDQLKRRYLENVRVHLPGETLPGIAPMRTPA